MILEQIKDIMKDYLIFDADNETLRIYNEHLCLAIKCHLDNAKIQNNIFIYPTNTAGRDEADYWCAVSWIEAEQMYSYGFNWMSAQREKICAEGDLNEN